MFLRTQISKTSKAVNTVIHSAKLITTIGTLSAMLAVSTPNICFAKSWLENVMSQSLKGSMSNSTGAKAFTAGTRNVLSGGSTTIRTKVFNDNISSFSPPSFSAGCGGLDFFAGSFSFINADQLVQLFRAVMANSIGVMFDMALRQVSPALAAIMQKFSDIVREVNSLLSDSCAIAKGISVDIGSALGMQGYDAKDGFMHKATSAAGNIANSAAGIVDDFGSWFGFKSGSTESGSPAKIGASNSNVQNQLKEQNLTGNLVWNVLKHSSQTLSGRMTEMFKASGSPEETMMSLVGYIIATPPSTNLKQTKNTSDETDFVYHDPTLDLESFLVGANAPKGYEMLVCDNQDECLSPQPRVDPSAIGFMQVLYRQLCNADSLDTPCSSDSAVGKLENNANAGRDSVSDIEAATLMILPPLVRSKLAELQIKAGSANQSGGESAGGVFIREQIKPIALNVAYNFTQEMFATMSAQTKSSKGSTSIKEVGKQVVNAKNDIYKQYDVLAKKYGTLDRTLQNLDALLKNYDNIPLASSMPLDSTIGNYTNGNK